MKYRNSAAIVHCNLTKTSPHGYNRIKEVEFASNRTRKAGNPHAQQSINTAVSRARKGLILASSAYPISCRSSPRCTAVHSFCPPLLILGAFSSFLYINSIQGEFYAFSFLVTTFSIWRFPHAQETKRRSLPRQGNARPR